MKFFVPIIACAVLIGCGPVTPDVSVAPIASIGSNGLHSDIYAVVYAKDGKTIIAQVWYARKRASYNLMIGLFGKQYVPTLKPDSHLTPDGPYWKADQTAIEQEVDLIRRYNKTLT